MRILFITHYFQPEPNFFFCLPFAKEFARRGHEVEVLTGFPNYPGGKIYDGYRVRFLQREILDGIPINRVPLYPSHDTSGFRRILNYMSYAFSAALIRPWVVKKFDVAYVYHPPATIFFPAWLIHFLRRMPIVYNIQDLWPDTLRVTETFKSNFGLKGDATDLVIKAKAGVSCQSGNSDSIFDAISKLVEMPKSELATIGMNGREFYNKELALDIGAKRYEKIFMSVIKKNKTK